MLANGSPWCCDGCRSSKCTTPVGDGVGALRRSTIGSAGMALPDGPVAPGPTVLMRCGPPAAQSPPAEADMAGLAEPPRLTMPFCPAAAAAPLLSKRSNTPPTSGSLGAQQAGDELSRGSDVLEPSPFLNEGAVEHSSLHDWFQVSLTSPRSFTAESEVPSTIALSWGGVDTERGVPVRQSSTDPFSALCRSLNRVVAATAAAWAARIVARATSTSCCKAAFSSRSGFASIASPTRSGRVSLLPAFEGATCKRCTASLSSAISARR
mmetsp:Transcript_94035/g.236041  ORF Transcript_94035/g.236041 Transcript_94035/m.236041 type:complete len:266 (-) Transcript_94035:1563-2360(-)